MNKTFSENGAPHKELTDSHLLEPWNGQAILLLDLDAFFAAVEQLDHPAWRGKPVIVGGDADKRGVVSTASYEARVFGVRSAMPSSQARSLCPDAIWTCGHFDRYRDLSKRVMDILYLESPFIQQVSIDEAFLDITPTAHNTEHPIAIAQRIQKNVEKLGITCSIGLGTSKTIAKIASDRDKPRGLTVIYPGCEKEFLAPLPVRALSGIGAAAERELARHGIETLGGLAASDPSLLRRLFGKNGHVMHIRAQGKDNSPVESESDVKSISNEITFSQDLTTFEEIEAALSSIAAKVGRRLRMKGLRAHTLSLKVRYDDRSLKNIQRRLEHNTDDDLFFTPVLLSMVQEVWKPGMPIRLLGVGMSGFEEEAELQARLFEVAAEEDVSSFREEKPRLNDAQKRSDFLRATDSVRDRFGEDAIRFGHEITTRTRTTGSGAKNPTDYK